MNINKTIFSAEICISTNALHEFVISGTGYVFSINIHGGAAVPSLFFLHPIYYYTLFSNLKNQIYL